MALPCPAAWIFDGKPSSWEGTPDEMRFDGSPGHVLHVDAYRTDSFTPDGSVLRPFASVQAAMDAIGAADGPETYMAEATRYFRVSVAPGRYVGDVSVPYRPHVALDLVAAVIVGDVTWEIPGWGRQPEALYPRLTIRADALRAAYPNASTHSVVGIEGELVVQGPEGGARAPTVFCEVHVVHAGVSGGVRFAGGNRHDFGHLFLERADVRGVYVTNDWAGVTLYAHNWGGGHTGGGNPGAGLGPLVGRVLPYTLQNLYISGGLDLADMGERHGCLWHNVVFEGAEAVYDVAAVRYRVSLDTASYRSWIGAASGPGQGDWYVGEGGLMALSDAPMGVTSNVTAGGVTFEFADGVLKGVSP